eukprot:COSAG02_NODE_1945_length_10305_cov_5.152165_2_plen_72_part_00
MEDAIPVALQSSQNSFVDSFRGDGRVGLLRAATAVAGRRRAPARARGSPTTGTISYYKVVIFRLVSTESPV